MKPGTEAETAAAILEETIRAGASEAEVFLKRGVSTELHVHQRRLESVSSAVETGVGVRLFLPGGRCGYVHTQETDPIPLRRLLEEAVPAIEETEGSEGSGLPEPPQAAASSEGAQPAGAGAPAAGEHDGLAIYDPRAASAQTGDRVGFLRRLEEAALETDPRIAWVDALFLLDGRSRVWLRNSKGFAGSYRQSHTMAVLAVLAREDEESISSYHTAIGRSLQGVDPEAEGTRAAERAVLALGGRRLPPRRVTAVFDPPAAASLLKFLADSFLGETRQRGRSLVSEPAGETVASAAVTLVDDGRLPGGWATAPWDGEGVATRRTVVVEGGVLKEILHDTRTAAAGGSRSTGNARRRSFRDAPVPGITNFHFAPGPRPTAEVLRDVPEALRVVNVMNVGGVNAVTGDLSIGASGVWLERGRTAHPVSGVTLSGNLRELLRRVVAVGDDLEFRPEGTGACGSPTLVVEGMTVAG